MTVLALIVAAGRGRRAGGPLPKQYRSLAGLPVLQRTVDAFLSHPAVDRVRVVIGPDDDDLFTAHIRADARLDRVTGGASRQESVRRGLESCLETPPETVLIHDGARPLVSAAVIDRVLAAVTPTRGAVPTLAVVDSLERLDDDGNLSARVAREHLHRLQTPQGFPYAAILAAHRGETETDAGDDSLIARAAGLAVRAVPGAERNLKITHDEDFERAETMLAASLEPRTGQGFDVHRFGPGDHVTLGGVRIPHSQGLVGHSDADVALHALTDAILGALGDGDIGQHFPPGVDDWRDADSSHFLAFAGERVHSRGGRITHLDLTLIAQAPKIGPHREAMRARIAAILALPVGRVSVKATTTEELGFTGRREGIAAQAVASLLLPPPDDHPDGLATTPDDDGTGA